MKFVISVLFFLGELSLAQADVVLRFLPHVSASAQKLGDIVLFCEGLKNQGDNLNKVGYWQNLVLETKPLAGEYLHSASIIAYLKAKDPNIRILWRGKKHALVMPDSTATDEEMIEKASTAFLQELRKKYLAVELTPKSRSKERRFTLDKVKIKVALPQHEPPLRYSPIRLSDGNNSDTLWFEVKAWQKVYIATKRLKKHSLLRSADFIRQKRNVSGLPAKPLEVVRETLWLTRPLNKGQILTEDRAGLAPAVIEGDEVKVYVKYRTVLLESVAYARQMGELGQTICLQGRAKQFFKGLVVGPKEVDIL